jgi:acyl-[acyl-carrier-protein]-phospholipid O-acyltransferase / long-chain-fatty-acid--[acyl-carrier-protein] ligase
LLEKAREVGIPELMVPKDIRPIESLPLLGSGKVDYVSVMAMVGG